MSDEAIQERTPEQEAKVQIIRALVTLAIFALVPLIERTMSDPDFTYRMRWQAKHLGQKIKFQMHEASTVIETTIGLIQIEQHLKKKWAKSDV